MLIYDIIPPSQIQLKKKFKFLNVFRFKKLFSASLIAVMLLGLMSSIFLFSSVPPIHQAQAQGEDWESGYSYRKQITIDNTKVSGSSNLTDFPILINMTDDDLRTTGNGGHVQNANGWDIIFTDSTGAGKLDHEIEKYTALTGEFVAHIEIPTLKYNENTIIYIYYGNDSISASQEDIPGTWDADIDGLGGTDLKMVQHLQEIGTNPQVFDSTSNDNDSISNSADPTTSGQIDGAQEFTSANNDKIDCGNNSSLNITDAITIEAWFYTSQNTNYQAIVDKKYNNPGGAFSLYLWVDAIYFTTAYGGASRIKTSYSTSYVDGWHHIAATFSLAEQKQRLYFDGDEVASDDRTVVLDTNTVDLKIGSGVGDFNGTIDEVRIYNRALTQEEISTQYNNQSNVGSFMSFGNEELQSDIRFFNASTTSSDYKRYSDFTAEITIKAPDSFELDSYIFSTNASGSWINDDPISISGTSYNASTIKQIPLPQGNEICWKYWAHAANGSELTSNEYCFTVVNSPPAHTAPLLESDWMNFTTEDLTVYNQSTSDADSDSVKNIINWYVDDASISILNMPFEGGSTLTSTKDYSDYGNDGTVNGATWNSTGGYDSKGAYEFDGDDSINVGDIDLTDAITVEAWFYTSQDTGFQAIVDKKHDNPNGAFSLYLGVDAIYFATAYGGASRIKTSYSTSYVDGWHHIAATFSLVEQKQRLYFDGDAVASSDRTVALDTNDLNLLIGNHNGTVGTFTGAIDEVVIYNRVLSQEEILTHFQGRPDLMKSNETQTGEVWKACITPNDGVEDGNKLCSNNLTISETTYPNITFISPTPDNGAITNEGKINVSIDINADSCKLKLQLQEEDSIFNVSIDSALYNQWEFKYPVTYIFDLPADASNVTAFKRDSSSEDWTQLQEKTSDEFFNGIECVRFDYPNNKAYVSVGFNTANNIYIKLENTPFATYNSIAKYYDNRKATYTLSNDNWGAGSASGGIWQGMANNASDRYQAACHAAKMYNLPISIAINTKERGTWDDPQPIYGSQQTWDNMQTELDSCTDNWCWEPVVHTRCHPCSAEHYEINGYEWTILGCRDDILANLTNIPFGQHIFEFILPCAYKNNDIRSASANEFIFLRDWNSSDHPDSIDYTSWNETYQFYGIGGLQTKSYDTILSSESPAGRYNESNVDELNDAFDAVYNADGIFYAMWHSDRYSNSVVHSTDSPESGTASTLMQHFAHIANKKDVWYAANGWLYSYRMVAERAAVTKESEEEKTMAVIDVGSEGFAEYTLTTDGTYYYRVWCDDAHDYAGETDNRSFLLDTIAPDISLSTPANNSSVGDSKPTLFWSDNEAGSGIDYYQLYIDGSLNADNISNSFITLTTALSCGSHTWYVKAVDRAGNSAQSASIFTINIACGVGIIAPPVSIIGQGNISQNLGGEIRKTFESGKIAKVIFPSDGIKGTIVAKIEPKDRAEVVKNNPLPQNTQIIGDLVADFKASSGNKQLEKFEKPISIIFTYTDKQVKEDGVNEKTLKIYWWDKSTKTWQVLRSSRVDTAINRVSASASHFTLFAVMGEANKKSIEDGEMTRKEILSEMIEVLKEIIRLYTELFQIMKG